MPARDMYHEHVRDALDADGWQITHDPLHLQWGAKDLYVDLGAEKLLAAERQGRKIAGNRSLPPISECYHSRDNWCDEANGYIVEKCA